MLVQVLAFLLANTFILFIIAFGSGLLARHWLQQGQVRKARWASRFAFGCSSLLAVLTLGLCVLMRGDPGRMFLNLVFGALWCWIATRDYKFMRMLG